VFLVHVFTVFIHHTYSGSRFLFGLVSFSLWKHKSEFRISYIMYYLLMLLFLCHFVGRRNKADGIATNYGLDGRGAGVRVPVGEDCFFSPRHLDHLWGPLQWLPGPLSPGVKRPRLEADHLPRSRIRGSIHPFPYTSSWRSALSDKHRDRYSM
jgi:hypothetical protein